MFVDSVDIFIASGKGGAGAVSFQIGRAHV